MPKSKLVKAEAETLSDNCFKPLPVWTLPRTPEAFDVMVEQMAEAASSLPREAYSMSGWGATS